MRSFLSHPIQLYREAYSNHPKEVWTLAAVTLINRMGTMVLPFLAVYINTVLGFSMQDAGFLVGAFGFGSLAGSFLGGQFTDRTGPKMVILVSLFFGGLFFIGIQFVETFFPLLTLIFLAALFGEAYRPAMSTAAANLVSRSETGRTMALLRLAINLGMTLAPALGGLLAATAGYSWLFWIDGTTCILAALILIWLSRNWPTLAKDAINREVRTASPGKDSLYLWYLSATFLAGFTFLQWIYTVPVFIKGEWGIDERYIGLLLGISSMIIAVFEMPLIHVIEKRGKIRIAVLIGIALIGISYGLFLLPKALILCFAAMILWTFGEIMYLPFNNSIPLNRAAVNQRGSYMSWYYMTWSLVNIAGPLLGFSLIDNWGFGSFWVLIAGMAGLGLLIKSLVLPRLNVI